MIANLLPLLALLLQGPPPPPPPEKVIQKTPLERFRALPAEDRARLVSLFERAVMKDFDPTIQRIVSIGPSFRSIPVAKSPTWNRAERWAKGVAPRRTLVHEGTKEYEAVRRRIPARTFLPDLNQAIRYSWREGRIVRRERPLSPEESFENFLHGYAPRSDMAAAQVLLLLDKDPKQRKIGAYLENLYADLDAKVYDGITLYEAWYSGEVLAVPDVDSIAFERTILRTHRFRSPIPANKKREKLYQRIQERAFAFRKYRTLREACAAAFVAADPPLDEIYKRLVPRFHYLFAIKEHDPEAVADFVSRFKDRDGFVGKLDEEIGARLANQDKWREQHDVMSAMQRRIRQGALNYLEHFEKQNR